jgi:hypothetical protein
MRGFLKFAGVAAAAALIAGCNPPHGATQQTACNCHGTVTSANPSAETQRFVPMGGNVHRHHVRTAYGYRKHHHRHAERSYVRSYYDEESYAYRSTSHVYHEDGDMDSGSGHAYAYASNGGGYASGGATADGFVDASDRGDRWQDGYGRWHSRSALGAKATRTRLDPYHGYDIDCPNGPHHY